MFCLTAAELVAPDVVFVGDAKLELQLLSAAIDGSWWHSCNCRSLRFSSWHLNRDAWHMERSSFISALVAAKFSILDCRLVTVALQ